MRCGAHYPNQYGIQFVKGHSMAQPSGPITPDSPVKSLPRMAADAFAGVLAAAGSPWTAEATALYTLLVAAGHDPAFWLAICGREHAFGTNRDSVLWRNDTRSWTNARSVRLPGLWHELIIDARRGGPYVRYASVADSLRDGCYRLDEPGYVYQQEGRHSIAAVIARWTEDDADAYVTYVVERMNAWLGGARVQKQSRWRGRRSPIWSTSDNSCRGGRSRTTSARGRSRHGR